MYLLHPICTSYILPVPTTAYILTAFSTPTSYLYLVHHTCAYYSPHPIWPITSYLYLLQISFYLYLLHHTCTFYNLHLYFLPPTCTYYSLHSIRPITYYLYLLQPTSYLHSYILPVPTTAYILSVPPTFYLYLLHITSYLYLQYRSDPT